MLQVSSVEKKNKENVTNMMKNEEERCMDERAYLLQTIVQLEEELKTLKESRPNVSTPVSARRKLNMSPSPKKSPFNSPQKLYDRIRDLKEEQREIKDSSNAEKLNLEKELNSQKRKYENLVKELTQTKNSLMNDKRQYERTVEKLKERISSLEAFEKRSAALSSQLEKEKFEKNKLHSELEDVKKKKAETATQLTKLREQLKEMQEEKRKEERKTPRSGTPQKELLSSQKERYNKVLSKLMEENNILWTYKKSAEELIENLNGKLSKQEGYEEIADTLSSALELEQLERQKLHNELQILLEKKQHFHALSSQLQADFIQLAEALKLPRRLEGGSGRVLISKETSVINGKDDDNKMEEEHSLKTTLDQLQLELSETMEDNAKQRSLVAELKKIVKSKDDEISKITCDMKYQIGSLQFECDNLKDKIKKIEAECEKLKEKNQELKDVENAPRCNANLLKQLRQLKEEGTSDMISECEKLRSENEKLKKSIENNTSRYEENCMKQQEQLKRIQDLENVVEKEKKINDEFRIENSNLKTAIEVKEEYLKHLSMELDSLKAKWSIIDKDSECSACQTMIFEHLKNIDANIGELKRHVEEFLQNSSSSSKHEISGSSVEVFSEALENIEKEPTDVPDYRKYYAEFVEIAKNIEKVRNLCNCHFTSNRNGLMLKKASIQTEGNTDKLNEELNRIKTHDYSNVEDINQTLKAENNHLVTIKREYEENLKSVKSEIQELRKRSLIVGDIIKLNDSLRNDNEILRKHVETLKGDYSKLAKELRTVEKPSSTMEEVEKEKETLQSENKNLLTAKEKYMKELESVQKEICDLKDKTSAVEEAKRKNKQIEINNVVLKSIVDNIEYKLKRTTEEMRTLKSNDLTNIEELKRQFSELERQNKNLLTAKEKYEEELKSVQKDIWDSVCKTSAAEQAKRKNKEIEESNVILKPIVESIENNLKRATEEMRTLKSNDLTDIEELKRQFSELERQNKNLLTAKEKYEKELENVQKEICDLKDKTSAVEEVKRKKKQIEENNVILKSIVEKIENNLKTATEEMRTLKSNDLTNIEELKRQFSELERRNKNLKETKKCYSQQLKLLEEDIDKIKNNNDNSASAISEIEQRNSELRKKNKSLKSEVKKYQENVEKMRSKLSVLSNSSFNLTVFKVKNGELETENKRLTENKEKCEQQLKNIGEELNQLKTSSVLLEEVTKKCNVLEKENEILKSVVQKDEERILKIKSAIVDVAKTIAGDASSVTEIENCAEFEAKVIDFAEIKEKHDREMERIFNFINLLSDYLEKKINRNSDLEDECKNLKLSTEACKAELETLKKEVDALRCDLPEQWEELIALKEENAKLKESNNVTVALEMQVNRLESQLEKLRENAVIHRETVSKLEKELFVKNKELSDAKIDLRILQRELKDEKLTIKTTQEQRAEAVEQLKKEREKVAEVENARNTRCLEMEREMAELREELREEKCAYELKIDEFNAQVGEMKTMMDKIDELEDNIKNLSNQMEEMRKKLRMTNEEKQKLAELNEQLKRNKDDCNADMNSALQKVNEWREKYEKLEKDYEELKEISVMLDEQVVQFEEGGKKLTRQLEDERKEKSSLQEKLCDVMEEVRLMKTQTNEEKSLRALAESKHRELINALDIKTKELENAKDTISEKDTALRASSKKICELEDYMKVLETDGERCAERINAMMKEMETLKMERTDLLTRLHTLNEENGKLHAELADVTNDMNILQSVINQLQSTITQLEAYHEERQMKSNATVQQHAKLVDLLQSKMLETSKKKRNFAEKIFKPKTKDTPHYVDFEGLLQLEKRKCKQMSEQLQQTQSELEMLKNRQMGSSRVDGNGNRVANERMVGATTTSNNEKLTKTKREMPHKFNVKLCTKPNQKCCHCEQPLPFGSRISQCIGCRLVGHISCSSKLPPTCVFSKEHTECLNGAIVLCSASTKESDGEKSTERRSLIDGWIRMLGENKCWEQVFAKVADRELLLYHSVSNADAEPMLALKLTSSLEITETVDCFSPHLFNVVQKDFPLVMKIEDGKSGLKKPLYLMAYTVEEKINWINNMKHCVELAMVEKEHTQAESIPPYKGTVITQTGYHFKVNCCVQLSNEVCILGTDSGVYSLKLPSDGAQPSQHSSNFVLISDSSVNVKSVKILPKIRIALFLCLSEGYHTIRKADLRLLLSNAESAACSEPIITMESAVPDDFIDCSAMSVSMCNTLIAVAASRGIIAILRWDDRMFVLKNWIKAEHVVDMQFTPSYLLYTSANVGFFSLNLQRYHIHKIKAEDGNRSASRDLCNPVKLIKISDDEYLACTRLFGYFVNQEGRRLNIDPLKWHLPPTDIAYNKHFIVSAHENCVSVLRMTTSGTDECAKSKNFDLSVVEFNGPIILGISKHIVGGIFIEERARNDTDEKRIVSFDAVQFMKQNPKLSWSSISLQSNADSEGRITNELNISGTDVSVTSSILNSLDDKVDENENQNCVVSERKVRFEDDSAPSDSEIAEDFSEST